MTLLVMFRSVLARRSGCGSSSEGGEGRSNGMIGVKSRGVEYDDGCQESGVF